MKTLKYILCALLLSAIALPSIAQEQNYLYLFTKFNWYTPLYISQYNQIKIKIEPDTEAPFLINVPEGNLYATTDYRSIALEFSEQVVRGEGAITYTITGNDRTTAYASGSIDNVGIDAPALSNERGYVTDYSRVTLTLPEEAIFSTRQNSYIYISFEADAFTDMCGNSFEALKGGLDNGVVNAPWWSYHPDLEAPYLVNAPNDNMYTATNLGRTIELEYNEPISRGEGAITYSITGVDGDGMPTATYAEGTIENIVINENKVTVSLPENALNKEEESYVFLDFAEGAFMDNNNNPTAALQGGVDNNGTVDAPWWMYDPNAPDTNLNLEIGEDGLGSYTLTYTSHLDGSSYQESTYFIDAAKFGITSCQYAVMYIGAFLNGTAANEGDWGLLPAMVEDNTFYIQQGIVGEATNPNDGNVYYVGVIALVLDDNGDIEGVYSEDYVPFVPYSEDPRALLVADENIFLAYAWIDMSTYATVDWIDIMHGWTFIPESMLSQTQALKSFKSATVENIKAKRVENFVKNKIKTNVEFPYLRGIQFKK